MNSKKARWACLVSSAALLACFAAASACAQSAESILQKTRDTYAQVKSYADTGVVLYEYGASSEDKHTFSTLFNRAPRHLLLDFHKQGGDRYVIWADPDAFHTWWKTIGQQTDYPNPNNAGALNLSAPNTGGIALKIPTLLWGKAFESAMLKIADPVLEGTEEIGGHRCQRIAGRASDAYAATGNEVNVRKVTIWIDAESFLVRKILEEWKPLPGQRNRVTTIFEPQANPALEESQFKFVPPAPKS
jgi:outer membrane lipoprotein-sorting protein